MANTSTWPLGYESSSTGFGAVGWDLIATGTRRGLFSINTHFLADPSPLMLFLTWVSFHPGVSTVHPASPATMLSSHSDASPSHFLQPPSPPRGALELGGILEPRYLCGSSQWDMMRPQKGSVSGDLSLSSSLCQLNSRPTGK